MPGPARPAWWVYYEDKRLFSADEHTWAEIPTDGVLCACYSYIKDNLLVATAKRRYTFYFWRGDVLENTDDLEAVLAAFPQFKRGLTSFDALRASQPMAELIRDALNDTLEDIPWPT